MFVTKFIKVQTVGTATKNWVKPETTKGCYKGLKRVSLICLLCPMLVNIILASAIFGTITDQSNFVNDMTSFYSTFPRPLKKYGAKATTTKEF